MICDWLLLKHTKYVLYTQSGIVMARPHHSKERQELPVMSTQKIIISLGETHWQNPSMLQHY